MSGSAFSTLNFMKLKYRSSTSDEKLVFKLQSYKEQNTPGFENLLWPKERKVSRWFFILRTCSKSSVWVFEIIAHGPTPTQSSPGPEGEQSYDFREGVPTQWPGDARGRASWGPQSRASPSARRRPWQQVSRWTLWAAGAVEAVFLQK